MRVFYPIILTAEESGFSVYVPDFKINTQGDDFAMAVEMARDAIKLCGSDLMADHKNLPVPSLLSSHTSSGITVYIDVDFEY